MLEELYVVDESGQMEINFEALELITSEEFVNAIKRQMYFNYKIVSVEKVGISNIEVILKCGTLFEIVTYMSKTGHVIHNSTDEYQLKRIAKKMGFDL